MCLIVFAWRPGHAQPLIVAANRDEFYARPSAALAQWPEAPGVYAGRDLEAGGTWLGIGPNGRFAALTNIRDLTLTPGLRSRGELPAAFLLGQSSPEDYLTELSRSGESYSGFNLLVADQQQMCHLNSQTGQFRVLEAGVYGLSNADLDSPWPKVQHARHGLAELLDQPQLEPLAELMHDSSQPDDSRLPHTGVGIATERLLSSMFIASANYGTRATTVLISHANGQRQLLERSFGPHGAKLGEVSLTL